MKTATIDTTMDFNSMAEEFIEQNRRGVIELAAPVLNINKWYDDGSFYHEMLEMNKETFEKIVYFSYQVVKSSDIDGYTPGQILNNSDFADYEKLDKKDRDKIVLISGAEAIRFLLDRVDIEVIRESIKKEEARVTEKMAAVSKQYNELLDKCGFDDDDAYEVINEDEELTDDERMLRDLRDQQNVLNSELGYMREYWQALNRFQAKGTSDLVLDNLVMFPVDVRGILKNIYHNDPCVVCNLFHHYNMIILRNNRVKRLVELEAPAIILRNEKRVLQERVDGLIANGKRGNPYTLDSNEIPAVSLSDIMTKYVNLV